MTGTYWCNPEKCVVADNIAIAGTVGTVVHMLVGEVDSSALEFF